MSLEVRAVTAADFAALADLFTRDHSPCHCRYWHFTGTNKEWEARCAFEPEKNRAELHDALNAGSDEARGVIALDGPRIVGWMKLTPRRVLTKLLARSPYKNLDEPPQLFAIGCFLIDPERRRSGVARALLEGGIGLAKGWGAKFIEAYPRLAENVHDAEHFMGPPSLFASLGFEIVRDQPQYPVMRRAL